MQAVKRIITLSIVASTIFLSNVVLGQQSQPCLTDELHKEWILKDTFSFNEELRANALCQKESNKTSLNKASIRYIPVVFHLVHQYGNENISQAQINDQLRILNEDFRKVSGTNGGSSTDPLAADMQYEFRLAQIDPNGNPTDGVNRIFSSLTANARDNTKAVSYWSSDKYYNIWVVNSIKNNTGDPQSIVLGYAQFPSDRISRPTTDGVVIRHDQVGVIGTGQASQAGRTLTHETGHWVGLYHTFQDGCGLAGDNCSFQGDQVCDTPPVASSSSGCQSGRNSCSSDSPDLPDMIKNYMDYSDGSCMNIYTIGQKARSMTQMDNYRSTITSTANLSAAGLNADGTYKTLTPSSNKAPFLFDVNVSSLSGTGWEIEPYNIYPDTAWQINQSIGHNDTKSMFIRNFWINKLNTHSAFFSPSYDLTSMSKPTLTFDIAYAKRVAGSQCKLNVYISNNYGRTEDLVKTFSSSDMSTADVMTTEFIPNATQWKQLSLDLSAYKSYTNFRIRFDFVSLKGNNVFMDNISVNEPSGINDIFKSLYRFNVFPNPANNDLHIQFLAHTSGKYKIQMIDINGKECHSEILDHISGLTQKDINLNEFKPGIYFVNLTTPDAEIHEKLVIEK